MFSFPFQLDISNSFYDEFSNIICYALLFCTIKAHTEPGKPGKYAIFATSQRKPGIV